MKYKIYYISELNLTSKSAYSIHVMKMCEAIKKIGYKINLFTIHNKKTPNTLKFYNIKNTFRIISIFKKKTNLNFFLRVIFSLKIINKTKHEKCIYLSRSIIFALIAAFLNKKIILELHHEITGFSNFLYNFLKLIKKIDSLNYIFLNKRLNLLYKVNKEKFIVLDDSVCIKDFLIKKNKKKKSTCVYLGSFFKGKGIIQILRLAKQNPNINFHIYGDKQYLHNQIILKNVKFFEHIQYKNVPHVLSQYDVALMPYQKKIKGRSSVSIEKYMSPLKMFDYMAAKMIILASNLRIYKHILKDNYNCKLIKVNDDKAWSVQLNNIFKNINKYNYLKKNAFYTAKKYTWEKRAKFVFNKFKFINN